MYALRINRFYLMASSIFLVSLFVSGPIAAAPVSYAFDFTGASDPSGNELIFTDPTDTLTATVSSWAEVGAGTLEQATLNQMTNGLGVCNSLEANCATKENFRGITEASGQDWILVIFSSNVNLTGFTVAAEVGPKDKPGFRDVTYFTGSLSSSGDLLGKSYADLIDVGVLGLTETTVLSGKGLTDITVNINSEAGAEVWGNAILIGGAIGGGADRILLNGMSTVVPIPASIWLLLSALGVLAGKQKNYSRPLLKRST
ncbi:MAG: hypothetical protein GQ538_12625 [Xanthomonadales bacterium]|nr:hypothetical protein [Xanthomonadales bacterium]